MNTRSRAARPGTHGASSRAWQLRALAADGRMRSALADTGHVNTVIIEVKAGADGRLYPARPLTREQRNRARWLAHNLVHRDGLSVRQAQRDMAESYGIRRSVGTIARDLELFTCPRCEDRE